MRYSSKKEKDEAFKNTRNIERWMFVQELARLLRKLEPGDWLTPNKVGNLLIQRVVNGESKSIGAIDFHWNNIEWFEENK